MNAGSPAKRYKNAATASRLSVPRGRNVPPEYPIGVLDDANRSIFSQTSDQHGPREPLLTVAIGRDLIKQYRFEAGELGLHGNCVRTGILLRSDDKSARTR